MSKLLLSAASFSAVVRAGDARQFGVDLQTFGPKILQDASDEALAGTTNLSIFNVALLRGKKCVSYRAYAAVLLLRLLARHISRRLKIRPPSRDHIVRGIIETLLDGTPMYAIRKDITSFYESIEVAPLKDRLLYDIPSSARMRSYIKAYFDTHCAATPGLPRGIGLSALLAELTMYAFDDAVREIPGVFKYFRYSDDILIFSTKPASQIDAQIAAALPSGMQFNVAKSSETIFPGKTVEVASPVLEYLGYSFKTTQQKKHSRVVRVGISSRKIKKIKSRLILSLIGHQKTPDWLLLRDRCHFLTCNFKVRRKGAEVLKYGPYVYSGIFYNYKMSGTYQVRSGKLQADPFDGQELKALDGFYHSLLKAYIAAGKIKLNSTQVSQLKKFSFWKGFSLRWKGRFTADRVAPIKRAWRNV